MTAEEKPMRTAKSAQTRAALVETALRMFRSQGYDKTTMRAIAEKAGLSVGNAYYYFPSKDALVLELYDRLQDEHRERAVALLEDGEGLSVQLQAILHTGIDVMTPYHEFGSNFISVAIAPKSPTSPFGPNAAVARGKAVGLFREALQRSRQQPPPAIREELPELLWLLYMGITLFWVYDQSPEQRRTRNLIDKTAPLVAKLVALSRLPGVRRITEDLAGLVREVKHD
jgi:AcrR family transcriptional regulator